MFDTTFAALLILATGLGDDPGRNRPAAPPAELSAPELRARILASQQRIESFYVEYTSDDYADQESHEAGTYTYRIVAAMAPASLLHVSAHGLGNLDWRDDPEMQRAIIVPGRALNIYDVNRSYVERDWAANDPLPGSLPGEFFFHATGLFPLTDRPFPRRPDDDGPVVLRDVAASDKFDTVRSHLEAVDGCWCHVLERPGRDVLWIDVERGCALLARELYSVESGALMWRCECSRHEEVAPGIWMPRELKNIHFDFLASDLERRQETILDTVTEVVNASVNDVDEALFEFEPRPGADRLNASAPVAEQTVPGGLDHLDRLVEWSRDTLAERWKQPGDNAWSRTSLIWALIGLCLGVTLGMLVPHTSEANREHRKESCGGGATV